MDMHRVYQCKIEIFEMLSTIESALKGLTVLVVFKNNVTTLKLLCQY
jgi:hypothetical protein